MPAAARLEYGCVAVLIASNLRKELVGHAALRRRLVQGRAPRPARARRAERRGQDDAPARARRRGVARGRRARLGEGRARRAARPAAARRERPAAARVRARGDGRSRRRSSASCARSSGDGRRRRTTAKTLARYATAQARLEHAGGYDWRDRAAVGRARASASREADLDRPLATFSGGELTRASLARALASQPDLLLLDEPTNHLDIETIEWLEGLLATIDAGVILVAHDRWFLEAVTTAVLELDRGRSVYFPGKWHVWRREQAARAQHRGARRRARRGEDRPARAVRRALRREGDEGEARRSRSRSRSTA